MAEYKFPAQVNYGWGLSLNMTGKAPAVAKRIFTTYADALAYVNDANDSAIAGLTLAVINDDEADKNGLYFVSKVGTAVGEDDGELKQVGSQSQIDGSIQKLAINYNSSSKKVELKSGEDVLSEFDATAFIKDGMLDSVALEENSIQFTFNTEASKEVISVDLAKFIDTANTIVLTGYARSVEENDALELNETDTINQAFGKLEKAIVDNEEVISNAINTIKTSVGLGENLEFIQVEGVNYINGATSVQEAEVKLDNAIKLLDDKVNGEISKNYLTSVTGESGISVTAKSGNTQTISISEDAIWDCGFYDE